MHTTWFEWILGSPVAALMLLIVIAYYFRTTWLHFFNTREQPSDATLWHKWEVFGFTRTEEGRWTHGPVWRKLTDKGWVYADRTESETEWLDRRA
jgi:hypothetical protein